MVLYDPSNAGLNSSKGAMVQANMYAWMAEGLGRVDISADPVISFEYADMERKAKNRVVNPLAHIQFATGLRPVRGIFSEHGARYTTKAKTALEAVSFPTSELAGNPYGEYYIQKDNAVVGTNGDTNQVRKHSKYLLKPKIDSFNLIPKLAHDIRIGTTSTGIGSVTDNAGAVITGATAGTTTSNVAVGGGSGTGATLNITTAGDSKIDSIAVVLPGTGYIIGDTIEIAENALDGTHAAFNLTVASNTGIDLSAVRTSYVNFELTAAGDTNPGAGGLELSDDTGKLSGHVTGATDDTKPLDIANDTFFVYDLSNNGDDGSYNVLATFKLHAKSKGQNQSETTNWPQSEAAGATTQYQGNPVDSAKTAAEAFYRLNGMPINTYERTVYDVSFVFTSDGGGAAPETGLEKKNGSDKVKYIAHVMSGSVEHMRFGKPRATKDADAAALYSNGGFIDSACKAMVDQGVNGADGTPTPALLCTRTNQYTFAHGALNTTGTTAEQQREEARHLFIAEAIKAGNVLDFSFTGITLNDTVGLELNSDDWVGDLIVPLTGDATSDKQAKESGGLQCVHIPDSIRTLRNDAAQSLAANFAGLTELLGSISISPEPDISMGEFNLLAFQPMGDASLSNANSSASDTTVNGPPAGTGLGNGRSAHGVFTISGDILINKVKNFMLGSNYDINGNYDEGPNGTIAKSAVTNETRNQHIHKIVYWSNAVQGSADVSLACACRDDNLTVPDAAGGVFSAAAAVPFDATNGIEAKAAVVSGTHFAATGTDGADGAMTKTGAFLTELSPQESAFFYIYPWASAEMCAISSANGDNQASFGKRNTNGTALQNSTLTGITAGSDDKKCNPFRHYQAEYLDGDAAGSYAEGSLDVDSISIAVPTFKGWLDNTHGYYNTEKKRTEWYSFCDICCNNNLNAVQINDISYVYQNLGPMTDANDGETPAVATPRVHDAGMSSAGTPHATFKPNGAGVARGSVNKSVLDIVFPDVTDDAGALLTATKNANETVDDGDDFCTLNFRIPLQAKTLPGKKRLDKVYNLNNGVVQLANESYELKNGFTAKVNATADNLSAISANVNELMNAYCPVIIRLMDEDTIGGRGHTGNVGTVEPGAGQVNAPTAPDEVRASH